MNPWSEAKNKPWYPKYPTYRAMESSWEMPHVC